MIEKPEAGMTARHIRTQRLYNVQAVGLCKIDEHWETVVIYRAADNQEWFVREIEPFRQNFEPAPSAEQSPASEPVAWSTPSDWSTEPHVTTLKSVMEAWRADHRQITPLYASVQPSKAPIPEPARIQQFLTEFFTQQGMQDYLSGEPISLHPSQLEAMVHAAFAATPTRDEVLEEAAKAADKIAEENWERYKHGDAPFRANSYIEGVADGADEASEAIRALKGIATTDAKAPHE